MAENAGPSPPGDDEEDDRQAILPLVNVENTIPRWLSCMSLICERVLEPMDKVVMGGCGHCICSEDCLSDMTEGQPETQQPSVTCPICHVEVPDLSDWVLVMDTLQNEVSEKDVKPICNICVFDNPGDMYCCDCDAFICTDCGTIHNTIRQTAKHRVLKKPDEVKARRALHLRQLLEAKTLCQVHPGEDAVYFCVTCDVSVCALCCRTDHVQHEVYDVAECRSKLDDDIGDAEALCERLQTAMNELGRKMFRGLPAIWHKVMCDLNREFGTLVAVSVARSKVTKEKTTALFSEENRVIDDKLSMMDCLRTILVRFQSIGQSILEDGDEESFAYYENRLEPMMGEISELATELVDIDEFVGSHKVFQMSTKWTHHIERFIKDFGRVSFGVPIPGPTYTVGIDGEFQETIRLESKEDAVTALLTVFKRDSEQRHREQLPAIHGEKALSRPELFDLVTGEHYRPPPPPGTKTTAPQHVISSELELAKAVEHKSGRNLPHLQPQTQMGNQCSTLSLDDYAFDGDILPPDFVPDCEREEKPCCSKTLIKPPPPPPPPPPPTPKRCQPKCKVTPRRSSAPSPPPVTTATIAQVGPPPDAQGAPPQVANLPIGEPPMSEQREVAIPPYEPPADTSDEPFLIPIDIDDPIDVETVDPIACDDEDAIDEELALLAVPIERSTRVADALSSVETAPFVIVVADGEGGEQELEAPSSTTNGQHSGSDGDVMISVVSSTVSPTPDSSAQFVKHPRTRPGLTPLSHLLLQSRLEEMEGVGEEELARTPSPGPIIQSIFSIPKDVDISELAERQSALRTIGLPYVESKPDPELTVIYQSTRTPSASQVPSSTGLGRTAGYSGRGVIGSPAARVRPPQGAASIVGPEHGGSGRIPIRIPCPLLDVASPPPVHLVRQVQPRPQPRAVPLIMKRAQLLPGVQKRVIAKPRQTTASQQFQAKQMQKAAVKRASVELIVRPAAAPAGAPLPPRTGRPQLVLVRHSPPRQPSTPVSVIVSSPCNKSGWPPKVHQRSAPSTTQAPRTSPTSPQQIVLPKGEQGPGVRHLGSALGSSAAVVHLSGQGVTRVVPNGERQRSPEKPPPSAKSVEEQGAIASPVKPPMAEVVVKGTGSTAKSADSKGGVGVPPSTGSQHGVKVAEVATEPPPRTTSSPVALVTGTGGGAKALLDASPVNKSTSTHVEHVSVGRAQSAPSANLDTKGATEGTTDSGGSSQLSLPPTVETDKGVNKGVEWCQVGNENVSAGTVEEPGPGPLFEGAERSPRSPVRRTSSCKSEVGVDGAPIAPHTKSNSPVPNAVEVATSGKSAPNEMDAVGTSLSQDTAKEPLPKGKTPVPVDEMARGNANGEDSVATSPPNTQLQVVIKSAEVAKEPAELPAEMPLDAAKEPAVDSKESQDKSALQATNKRELRTRKQSPVKWTTEPAPRVESPKPTAKGTQGGKWPEMRKDLSSGDNGPLPPAKDAVSPTPSVGREGARAKSLTVEPPSSEKGGSKSVEEGVKPAAKPIGKKSSAGVAKLSLPIVRVPIGKAAVSGGATKTITRAQSFGGVSREPAKTAAPSGTKDPLPSPKFQVLFQAPRAKSTVAASCESPPMTRAKVTRASQPSSTAEISVSSTKESATVEPSMAARAKSAAPVGEKPEGIPSGSAEVAKGPVSAGKETEGGSGEVIKAPDSHKTKPAEVAKTAVKSPADATSEPRTMKVTRQSEPATTGELPVAPTVERDAGRVAESPADKETELRKGKPVEVAKATKGKSPAAATSEPTPSIIGKVTRASKGATVEPPKGTRAKCPAPAGKETQAMTVESVGELAPPQPSLQVTKTSQPAATASASVPVTRCASQARKDAILTQIKIEEGTEELEPVAKCPLSAAPVQGPTLTLMTRARSSVVKMEPGPSPAPHNQPTGRAKLSAKRARSTDGLHDESRTLAKTVVKKPLPCPAKRAATRSKSPAAAECSTAAAKPNVVVVVPVRIQPPRKPATQSARGGASPAERIKSATAKTEMTRARCPVSPPAKESAAKVIAQAAAAEKSTEVKTPESAPQGQPVAKKRKIRARRSRRSWRKSAVTLTGPVLPRLDNVRSLVTRSLAAQVAISPEDTESCAEREIKTEPVDEDDMMEPMDTMTEEAEQGEESSDGAPPVAASSNASQSDGEETADDEAALDEYGAVRRRCSARGTTKVNRRRRTSPVKPPASGPVVARLPDVEPDVRGFGYIDPQSVEVRPGHGQMKITNVDANEDYCDICKDGGDDPIICCDQCPKVFHGKCHIPVLDTAPEEDPWACGVHWSVDKIASMYAAEAVEGCHELVPANPMGFATACKFLLRCYQLPHMEHMRWDFPQHYFSMYGKYPAHIKYIRERLTLQNPEKFSSVLEMLNMFRQMFQQAALYYQKKKRTQLHIPSACFRAFLEVVKDVYADFGGFFDDITF